MPGNNTKGQQQCNDATSNKQDIVIQVGPIRYQHIIPLNYHHNALNTSITGYTQRALIKEMMRQEDNK